MREVRARRSEPHAETIAIEESQGRILAEDVAADRDYPPFNRSVRDGFAVRAADMPGRVRVIGEVARGQHASRASSTPEKPSKS